MNRIEQCEIEFQTGRKAGREEALPKFTTQELMQELCKRDGVVDVPIHQYNDTYYLPIAEKIIVVVKK